MARRTLYPTTPGETAIDRLLNQTLPNILKEERARQEREELREEEKARYQAEFQYRVERDTKTDRDNFNSQFDNYYLAAMEDKENKNFDGGNIFVLEKHANNSKFTSDSQLNIIKTLKSDLENGQKFSDLIDMNTKTIKTVNASKIDKFKSYIKNQEILNLYGTQTQKSDFEKAINETGDSSLGYINSNRNHLGVISGMNTQINQAFLLTNKIESGMDFDTMDSASKEAFLPYLSPADQERFKSPFGSSPNYQAERNSALKSAYLRAGTGIFNQEGNDFLEQTIATYGGQDNFVFSMNQLREQEPFVYKNFIERFSKAGDLATRGTTKRIEAEAAATTEEERVASVEEYITQYMEEKGFPRSLFDAPEPKPDPEFKDVINPYRGTFEGLSAKEIVKVIADKGLTDPIFGDVENYFMDEIKAFEALQAKRKDSKYSPTSSEENEFKRLNNLMNQFSKQYKLLTNDRYLRRRGAGKYVVGQTGADTNTYPYSNESFKRTTPQVRNALKIVSGIEEREASIQALQTTLQSARMEGNSLVVTDPAAIEGLKSAELKKGTTKKYSAETIREAITNLEKQNVLEEKKLKPITELLKNKFDLFKDYNLIEVINQGEDLSARDISYMIMPKNN
jgi:hypothetical protein